VYKPIQAEAEAAAAAALALRCGEDPMSVDFDGESTGIDPATNTIGVDQGVPYIALTPIGVTVDNIAETVIADGFRTWEEICTGEFEEFCPADR
jgi:D-xylose transport system substrate-binding protein